MLLCKVRDYDQVSGLQILKMEIELQFFVFAQKTMQREAGILLFEMLDELGWFFINFLLDPEAPLLILFNHPVVKFHIRGSGFPLLKVAVKGSNAAILAAFC